MIIRQFATILYVFTAVIYSQKGFSQGELPIVKDQRLYDETVGLPFTLDASDKFGRSIVTISDLDGNGYPELAVGANGDDDAGTDAGAVYILFMDSLQNVISYNKIAAPTGISAGASFGISLANMGDMNGDGIDDILVGAHKDEEPVGTDIGSVTLLLLNSSGGYSSFVTTIKGQNGLPNHSWLNAGDDFGHSIANIGDIDGNGVNDAAVGLIGNNGGSNNGAIAILKFDASYAVIGSNKIGIGAGFNTTELPAQTGLGSAIADIGDQDGDGVTDLMVGGYNYKAQGIHTNSGSVWTLFLNADGTLKNYKLTAMPLQGRNAYIGQEEHFGRSITYLGDINSDGFFDVAIGGGNYHLNGTQHDRGAIYFASFDHTGKLQAIRKHANDNSNFSHALANSSWYGVATTLYPDTDGDGLDELFAGAPGIVPAKGSMFLHRYGFLNEAPMGTVTWYNKVTEISGYIDGVTPPTINPADRYGRGVAPIGDINGDGHKDIVVGRPNWDAHGANRGGLMIQYTNGQGEINGHIWINAGHLPGLPLDNTDLFGVSVDTLGDFDGNGTMDLVVGAMGDDDGFSNAGAVYLLMMQEISGVVSVLDIKKISSTQGGFTGTLGTSEFFGSSVTSIGDLDNDGVMDIAVGSYLDDEGGRDAGSVWILFLNSDGTVKSHQKISDNAGGLAYNLPNYGSFGISVDGLGDIDNDGNEDIIVGMRNGSSSKGGVFILHLNSNGTVKSEILIDNVDIPAISTGTYFGTSVSSLSDINGDGVQDIAVGAHQDGSNGTSYRSGAIWIICLDSAANVIDHQKICSNQGRFNASVRRLDIIGISVADLGDINNDGSPDIAIGSYADDESGKDAGAVYITGLLAKKSYNYTPGQLYAELKRKMDGSFVPCQEGVLYFNYDEEYEAHDLRYNVYGFQSTPVVTENDQALAVEFGENNLSLDFTQTGNCLSNGYYILEVINTKNEKFYLRFRQSGNYCPYVPPKGAGPQ